MLTRLRQLLDNKWLVRLRNDRAIREALFAFLLTRALIFAMLMCIPLVQTVSYPEPYHEPDITLENAHIARQLRKTMVRGDVGHYMGLSQTGYSKAPFDVSQRSSQSYAFFPLHPMLIYVVRHIFKDPVLWTSALCNLFFFLALVFLYKLTLAFGYEPVSAHRAIFYLAAFPLSYFFSVPMTESMFVFLTVASFYAAKREHWWAAALFGMCASATRLTGVLLLPALVVLSWEMYRSLQIKKIVGLLLIPFGLFAYMFYSWWLSGDVLAFKHAAAHWGRNPTLFILGPLLRYLSYPYHIVAGWDFNVFNVAATLLCFFCLYILVRRRQWALALYTFMSIALPLSSGMLQSLGRYTMGFFPVFIALAIAVKSDRVDQAIRFIFVFLLGIMSVLYAAGYANALS